MIQPGPTRLSGTLSNYLERGIGDVDGWLSPISAAMIAYLAIEQSAAGVAGDLCEIGVHHGKLFLILALAAMPGEWVRAVDVFADQDKNLDRSGAGDRAVFERHLARFAADALVEIIQHSSLDLAAQGFLDHRFRLISIDGGHTAAVTENDLHLAESTLLPGGIAVLDDVLSYDWTGVITGLARYLGDDGRLVPFALSPNKAWLAATEADAVCYAAALRRGFPQALSKPGLEFLGATVDSYWEHPYYNREGCAGLARERDDLRHALAAAQGQLEALHRSTSWRLTAPLRRAGRLRQWLRSS